MKRIITLILAFALVLTTMAGCGKKSDKKATQANSNAKLVSNGKHLSWDEIKDQMPAEYKGKELTFYNWNEMNSIPNARRVIDKFTEETGIKINWIVADWDDYATILAAKITTDDAPDIVRLGAGNNDILPYCQPLNKTGFDFTDEAWNLDLMYYYQVNGNIYGAIMKDTPFFMPTVCYYNRSLIEKYGLDDPYDLWKNNQWTWDKEMEICKKFLKLAGGDYMGLTPASGGDYATSVYGKGILSYEPEKGKYVSYMNDTDILKSWQWMAQKIDMGLVTKQHLLIEEFNEGKILFYHDSLIGARTVHYYHKPLKNSKNLGVVPLPCEKNFDDYYVSTGENEAYGIAEGAKNAEIVPYFLRFFLDEANYDMDKFYYDEQSAEVAEWCKTKKIVGGNASGKVNAEIDGESSWTIREKLRTSGAQNVKNMLDTYAPIVQACADRYNELYAEK